jgi:release factor glutamine methyltransferase
MAVKLQTIDDSKRILTDGLKDIYSVREASSVVSFLIESVTGLTHLQQMTDRGREIAVDEEHMLLKGFELLKQGTPVQHVAGYAWFLGRKFAVNREVLIPRQETEELVVMALKKAQRNYSGTVIDFCTGSGCIAISMACSLTEANIYATDISAPALKTASENCSFHGAQVTLLNHDLLSHDFSGLPAAAIILSNPPYVRESEKALMEPGVTLFEPHGALFVDDSDPLIFYRALLAAVEKLLLPGGWFCFEINEALGKELVGMFSVNFITNLNLIDDINSKNRFIAGTRV